MSSKHDEISREAEAEFLDNGGAMTIERRDHYFVRAMKALKEVEAGIDADTVHFHFARFSELNIARANRWHKGNTLSWSVSDWACAMAGEAGEVCNAVKKLRRIEEDFANLSEPDRQLSTVKEAYAKIGEEIADTVIYLDLLAHRLGLDLGTLIRLKFNATSVRYSFPERL